MPINRKEYAKLQKKIKLLRLRVAELEKNNSQHKQVEYPPQKSDVLYQILMKNINLGITFINPEYRIVTTNAGQGKMFHKPHTEFIGKYCFREFEKRSEVCPHCPGTRAMATKRPAEVETEGVRDDGSRTPAHLWAFPVLEADGSIKGFVEVVEDISERKQAEEALHESEQRYRSLTNDVLDSSKVGIFILDDNFRIVWVNQALETYFGLKREDVIGRDKRQLIRQQIKNIFEEPDTFVEKVFATYDNNTYIEHFECHVLADGQREERWLEHWSQPIHSGLFAGGRIEQYTDITEHKKAEEKLWESENKYKTLLENLPQKIFLKDKNSVYISCNTNYAADMKIEPDEITGKTDYQFYPKKLAKKYRADDRRIMESGKTEDIEEKYIKEGQELFVHTVKTPVRDEQGNTIGLLGIFWDITEQKKMEEELSIYRDKMAQAERLASLGTLSATLAHELTQPLTVIRLSIENSLEDLKAKSCPKSVIEMLRDSLNEVSNATSVIDRFRNYARQSSRKTFREINVGAIAERIVLLLSKTAQRAKMTLCLKGMNKLPAVYSNEKDIEQLFFALTENAIQATDGKKSHQLTIEGAVKNKNIELRFSDNCCGIAPENINRIFGPFFTTGSDDGRTGLGLPIVQRILSGYGGKIRVRSQFGKGTTFYVTLPIYSKMIK
jgi:PAS domain S-box-containing protein